MREAVLDVVERRVDEHTSVIPSTGLDADSFVDEGMLREVLVRNGDR